LLAAQPALADQRSNIKDISIQFAKPLEAIMVDGPLYVDGTAYYVADYLKPDSSVAASLVYDTSSSTFTPKPEIIRKVLATKDLKKLTVSDPLFFAAGDSELLILASKYETQNVRNFASYSSATPEEQNILEIFLKDYEDVMKRVANVSSITQDILYPNDGLQINLQISPPAMQVQLLDGFSGGHFTYEGFEKLISSYEDLYHDYRKLSADLSAFAGGLPEFPPGAIIREKWEVQITKEGILEEVALIEENGESIKIDTDLRKEILTHPFTPQINEAQERLGATPNTKGLIPSITLPLTEIKTVIFAVFILGILFLLIKGRKPPEKAVSSALLLALIFAGLVTPALSQSTASELIPTMDEIIDQKVDEGVTIPYTNHAEGLPDNVVENLLLGFRLVFKGEAVEVLGPYNHFGKPYYFFDIQRNSLSTGYGFLVDAEKFRLVGDQRQAYQLLKTLLFSDLLKEKPLYISEDPDFIEEKAKAILQSPLDMFLINLSVNVREGIALEERLIESPDFEILLNLTKHYVEAYILLQNINQIVSEKESEKLTGGFSKKVHLLDAYSRATRGLSAQEFLRGRTAQYRGRTLNRLPLIKQLSSMGLQPSKAQVAHDLTSDLIHDNVYLWRKGAVTNPNLFARLSFREGTFTLPQSAANFTINTTELSDQQ
jgi:hypothetical protein